MTLTREAAAEIFGTVGGFAKKRIWERQWKSVLKDVEGCLDRIEGLFEEPPWENGWYFFLRVFGFDSVGTWVFD